AAPKALIIDEGQDAKERGTNRSQACEQLAAAVTARDGLILDLTGTAILNRPRELCQQLTILGRIGEFGGPKAFLWRYCLAEADLRGYRAAQARQAARQLGEDPDSAAVQAVMRASAAEHLVAIGALRQLAGQAKRGYVTAWVHEHVTSGEKVMIAAHHRDEVD